MNSRKYKLTISVLASNRKDTLPKTLESLKPILDNVSSELIIVDTGCDEELLEIVREYTDKIIKFEWCKDFSKARNVGIDNASGEWFMFIDDDEWFEDVSQFIDFFNTDEYKKYGYGKYIVRNYDTMDGSTWMDSVAGRMFRLLDNTKFIDAIHERPTNIAGPTKAFTAYAHHYGYVFKTPEDKEKHFQRNLSLLKAQVEREPGIVRHYCHITQEFNTVKDYENSLKYAYEGIEKADMTVYENSKDLVGLYGNVIWVLVNQQKHQEVIDKAEEYFKSSYMNKLGEMAIYGFCAVSEYLLKNYKRAVECVDNFIERFRYLDTHVEERFAMDAILVTSSMEKSNYSRVIGIGLVAAATDHNEEKVIKYGSCLDFSETPGIIDGYFCMKYLVDMIGESDNADIYVSLVKNIEAHKEYYSNIINRIISIRDEDYEKFLKIASVMDRTGSNNGYVQYLRIINRANEGDAESLKPLYEKAVKEISDLINVEHEFWEIAKDYNIDIYTMLKGQSVGMFINGVEQWIDNVKLNVLVEKLNDLAALIPADSIHMKYMGTKVAEAFFRRKKLEGVSLDELKAECKKYYTTVISYYAGIYKESVFEMYETILPKNCQAALLMSQIEKEENKEIISEKIKKIVKVMPKFGAFMEKYDELVNGR